MEFRPCIDIHNGIVKQIVGGSLKDEHDQAVENFVSKENASYYAKLYKKYDLKNGHIILLNGKDSPYYEATREQALEALRAYPGGMQIGGGINGDNAKEYIDAGASHVIVTSYVFENGVIRKDRLEILRNNVGKKHIVLDVSCRKKGNSYYIMTNRWQTYTDVMITYELLDELSEYCDEFLIHAVDVEGKANGIETDLVSYLRNWKGNPITYAGGVHSLEDISTLKEMGKNHIHVTVGSAMTLFGGKLEIEDIIHACN